MKTETHVFLLRRFKNVIFEIAPAEAVGVFEVKAKLLGVHFETLQLEYQVCPMRCFYILKYIVQIVNTDIVNDSLDFDWFPCFL